MYVIEQPRPVPTPIPGLSHATWAGSADGLEQLSLWRQSLAPGAATPPHSHDCDEVVMCESGQGAVLIGDRSYAFGAHSTLILPRDQLHQIVNNGAEPLEILGVFGATPVNVFLPDKQKLDLPWRS